jgi:hypothetical protein
MMKVRFAVGFFLAYAATAFLSGCREMPPPPKEQKIKVCLNRSVDHIDGIDWRATGGLANKIEVRYCDLNLVVPSGRNFRFFAPQLFLTQKEGLLKAVTVCPLKGSVPFHEARQELEKLVRTIGVADQPLVRQRLEQWERDPPGDMSVSTGGVLEHRVDVFFAIRPVFDADNTWYISMTFTYLELENWKLLTEEEKGDS